MISHDDYHREYYPWCRICKEKRRIQNKLSLPKEIQDSLIKRAEEKRNRKKLKRIG